MAKKRKIQHVPSIIIATIYVGLGNKEKALDWLEQDWEERGQGVLFWELKTYKRFDPVRNDTRFQVPS